MYFVSTRNKNCRVSGAEAVVGGIAPDGGLYVPETFPTVSADERAMLVGMDYPQRAAFIISKYLPELRDGLEQWCEKAYSRFDGDPAPVVKADGKYLLELWHGPTHAFKDMALTLLPYLLTGSKKALKRKDKTLILVATSGDTGKAALEGFRDVDGTACMVFYPESGVSGLQKLQMITQRGENVFVSAIKGNFDDAQTAVKKVFADSGFKDKLAQYGYNLSSANSINFGRLVPQIAYYFSAYADLTDCGEIEDGEKISFCVPTGNFGNILAAYYAYRMGLPIKHLICASNSNSVLTDFLASGSYDLHRPFHKTVSPSMDILISSNFERLIFETSGRNDALTAERMKSLCESGGYRIGAEEFAKINSLFKGYCASDEITKETIGEVFDESGYILDPHSAVAVYARGRYEKDFGESKVVTVCTASPYKFVPCVLESIGESVPADEKKALEKLEDETALPLPDSLKELPALEKRFTGSAEKDAVKDVISDYVSSHRTE